MPEMPRRSYKGRSPFENIAITEVNPHQVETHHDPHMDESGIIGTRDARSTTATDSFSASGSNGASNIKNKHHDKEHYQLIHVRLKRDYLEALHDLEWICRGKSRAKIVSEAIRMYAKSIPGALEKSEAVAKILEQ